MANKARVGDPTSTRSANREFRDNRSVLLKRNLKGKKLEVVKPKVNSQVGRTRYMGILGSGGRRLRENLSFLVRKELSLTSRISSRRGRVEGTEVSSSKELEVVKSNKMRFLVLPNLSGSKGYVYPPRGGVENNELEQLEVFVPLSSIFNPEQGGWLARILQKGRIDDCPFMANSELLPSFEQEMAMERPSVQRRLFIPEVFRQGSLPQGEFSLTPYF